jgi:prepilin peptidase CpaA
VLEAISLARNVCLLAMSVICVYTDLARGKLYNSVTLSAIAAGLAFAWLLDSAGPGLPNLQAALLGAALGGGVMLVAWLVGSMGAGDVKMMAAVGVLAGSWRFTLLALMYAALVGAAIGIGVLIWQGRLWEGVKGSLKALVTLKPRKDPGRPPLTIPYGVAIGIGVVWAWMELMVL